MGKTGIKPLAGWTLGPIRLRNRLIKAATNEGLSRHTEVTSELIDFHRRQAAGGVGLSTLAYCAVNPQGRTFVDQIVMRQQAASGLKALAQAVHAEGGAISAQLTHGGAFHFLPDRRQRPWSASSGFNPAGLPAGHWRKREMGPAQLSEIRQAFVDAARLARDCDFDAVELHLGHGYLLSQFLSPRYNRRQDAYGGGSEQRMRFPVELVRAVVEAVGDELAVLVKFSMVERLDRPQGLTDSQQLALRLQAAGAHLLVLSAGMNVEAPWSIFGSPLPAAAMAGPLPRGLKALAPLLAVLQPVRPFRPLYLLEPARSIRAVCDMPLAYLGGVRSLAHLQQLADDGFDAMALGRALLEDPFLPRRWSAGQERVSACDACNLCVARMYEPGGTSCVRATVEEPIADGNWCG